MKGDGLPLQVIEPVRDVLGGVAAGGRPLFISGILILPIAIFYIDIHARGSLSLVSTSKSLIL